MEPARLFEHLPQLVVRYATKGVLRREVAAWQSADHATWLSSREQAILATLRDPARREDWLLGRWLAKQVVALAGDVRSTSDTWLSSIEVLPQQVAGLPSRPQVCVAGNPLFRSISISHDASGVLVACSRSSTFVPGVDLVVEGPANPGFLRLWFNDSERTRLAAVHSGPRIAWGVKEATYKALQQGERFTPRAFTVNPQSESVWNCHYQRWGRTLDVHLHRVAPHQWALLAMADAKTPQQAIARRAQLHKVLS